MGKKRKVGGEEGELVKEAAAPKVNYIFLHPIQNADMPPVQVAKQEEKRLIIVLEGAHLESCKTGKDFSLLNIDEHRGLLSR